MEETVLDSWETMKQKRDTLWAIKYFISDLNGTYLFLFYGKIRFILIHLSEFLIRGVLDFIEKQDTNTFENAA